MVKCGASVGPKTSCKWGYKSILIGVVTPVTDLKGHLWGL